MIRESDIKANRWDYGIYRVSRDENGTILHRHDRTHNLDAARLCAKDALKICPEAIIFHEGTPIETHTEDGETVGWSGRNMEVES